MDLHSKLIDTVIPEKDGEGNPNTKPEGYKEVTFVVKDDDKTKGSLEGTTKYYVNPTEYEQLIHQQQRLIQVLNLEHGIKIQKLQINIKMIQRSQAHLMIWKM